MCDEHQGGPTTLVLDSTNHTRAILIESLKASVDSVRSESVLYELCHRQLMAGQLGISTRSAKNEIIPSASDVTLRVADSSMFD